MKFYILVVCISAHILLASSRILPTKFPQFCSKSTPKYNECMREVFHKIGPMLVKGVREINFPRLNPLEVVSYSVNRSLNEFITVAATIKDMKNWGYDQMKLENFEFNPETLQGNLHLTTPVLKTKMKFEVEGHVMELKIDSSGFVGTKADNLGLIFTFTLKKFEKIGVEYFTFEKFTGKSTYDNISLDLATDNPEFQPTVDSIISTYNQNPRFLREAIDPIYQEAFEAFYRSLAEKILESIPAKELIPE